MINSETTNKDINKKKRIINKIRITFSSTENIFKENANIIPIAKGTNNLINGYLNQEIILQTLIENEAMYAYNFEGRRYDVGDKLGFLQATVEFALKKEDLREPFIEYLTNRDWNK